MPRKPSLRITLTRFLALTLILNFSVTRPAFALRQAGLEENSARQEYLDRVASLASPSLASGLEEVRAEARFEAYPFMDYNQLTLIQRDVIRQLRGIKKSPLFGRSSDLRLYVGLDKSPISSLFIRGKKGLFGSSSLSLSEVIRNSVDAIAESAQRLNKEVEGIITARVSHTTEDLWIIEMTDNGTGIPLAVLQEIASHRPVTTKDRQQQGSLGGSGTALWLGVVGSDVLKEYEGIIQIDTLSAGMKKASLLINDKGGRGSSLSKKGQRTERGTTLRLIFKNGAIFGSKAGLEEPDVFTIDPMKIFYRTDQAGAFAVNLIQGTLIDPEQLPGLQPEDIQVSRLGNNQNPAPYTIVVKTSGEVLPEEVWKQNRVAVITLTPQMTLAQLIQEALAQWTGRPIGEIIQIEHEDGRLRIYA